LTRLQVKVYFILEVRNGRSTGPTELIGDSGWRTSPRRSEPVQSAPLTTLRRGPMTPILLLVAFLLVLDVLVLLGRSHDSRDGRDWQPRGSPSPGPSAVAPI
jgi:hypothetical protein